MTESVSHEQVNQKEEQAGVEKEDTVDQEERENFLAGRTVVDQGDKNLVTFANGYSYTIDKRVTLLPSQEILMQMRTKCWNQWKIEIANESK